MLSFFKQSCFLSAALLLVLSHNTLDANEINADCSSWAVFSDDLHPNCVGGVNYIYVEATLSVQNDAGELEPVLTTSSCVLLEPGVTTYSVEGTWGEDLPEGTYVASADTSFYSTNQGLPEQYLRDLAAGGCGNPVDNPLVDGSRPSRCASSTPLPTEPFTCDPPKKKCKKKWRKRCKEREEERRRRRRCRGGYGGYGGGHHGGWWRYSSWRSFWWGW